MYGIRTGAGSAGAGVHRSTAARVGGRVSGEETRISNGTVGLELHPESAARRQYRRR